MHVDMDDDDHGSSTAINIVKDEGWHAAAKDGKWK